MAQEIRAELGRQQLSNRRLAMAIGVSFMWVNRRISTGETDLTFEDTQRIANALGVPVQSLLVSWLEHGPSPTTAYTRGSVDQIDTLSDDNVIALWVGSQHSGETTGVMRTTRTAAA